MGLQQDAINEEIANDITKRTIYGQRFSQDLYRRILAILIDLERDLRMQIYDADVMGVTRTAWQRNRQQKLLDAVYPEIRSTYNKIKKTSSGDLFELNRIEARATKSLINSAGASVNISMGAGLPTPSVMAALTDDFIVSGESSLDWWTRQEEKTFYDFKRAIQLGVTAGESNEQIVKRVVSSNPQVTTSDGSVMTLSKKGARILVGASVSSVQNNARVAVFEQNADLFEGIYQLSVLDSKTSKVCIARNGKLWDTITKEPIGHSIPFAIPPHHPFCRSILLPKTIGGKLPPDYDTDQWLKSRPVAQIQQLLGKGATTLYLNGDITSSELIDQSNRPLTLAELEKL